MWSESKSTNKCKKIGRKSNFSPLILIRKVPLGPFFGMLIGWHSYPSCKYLNTTRTENADWVALVPVKVKGGCGCVIATNIPDREVSLIDRRTWQITLPPNRDADVWISIFYFPTLLEKTCWSDLYSFHIQSIIFSSSPWNKVSFNTVRVPTLRNVSIKSNDLPKEFNIFIWFSSRFCQLFDSNLHLGFSNPNWYLSCISSYVPLTSRPLDIEDKMRGRSWLSSFSTRVLKGIAVSQLLGGKCGTDTSLPLLDPGVMHALTPL